MNDENIHIGTLLKQFFGYWKIYVPIGIICLIAAICFLIATSKESVSYTHLRAHET